MESSVIAAVGSICAALIAFLGSVFVALITTRASERSRVANEQLTSRLKHMEKQQATNHALFKAELDRVNAIAIANHSKRTLALLEAFTLLAEVKLLAEAFLVPLFPHSQTGSKQTLIEAANKFEILYKHCVTNSVFFDEKSTLLANLGSVMGHINYLLNIAQSGTTANALAQQANIVISGVDPILSQIRKEVRSELRLDI